jgi:Protein of unknown function (DUF4232)
MMYRRGLQVGCAVVLAGAAAAGCSSGSPTKTTKTTTSTTTKKAHPTTTSTKPSTTVPASSTTSTPPTTSANGSPCTTGQLSVSVGQAQGAAGSQIIPLVFQNTGTTTCTMQGYPGVSMVDASGAQVGAAAARTGQTAPLVTLTAGQSTTAIFRQANPGIINCTPVAVQGFRVYPPNQTTSVIAADSSLTTCPNNAQESPQISPVGTTP